MRPSSARLGSQLTILRKRINDTFTAPVAKGVWKKKIDWNVAHSFSLAIPFSQALFLSSFSLIIKIQKKYAWVGWSWASFSITLTPMILCLQYVKEGIKNFKHCYTIPMYPLHDLWLSSWRQIVVPKVIFSLHQLEENINLREENFFFFFEVFMAFFSPPPPIFVQIFFSTYLDF